MELFRSSNIVGLVSIVSLTVILFVGARRTDRMNAIPAQILSIPTGIFPKADELLSTAFHKNVEVVENEVRLTDFEVKKQQQATKLLDLWRKDHDELLRNITNVKSMVFSCQDELARLKDELETIDLRSNEFEAGRLALMKEIDNAWSEYVSSLGRADANEKYERWYNLNGKALNEFDRKVKKSERAFSLQRARIKERIYAVEQVVASKKRELKEQSFQLESGILTLKEIKRESELLKRPKKKAASVELAGRDAGFKEFYMDNFSRLRAAENGKRSLVDCWCDEADRLLEGKTQPV